MKPDGISTEVSAAELARLAGISIESDRIEEFTAAYLSFRAVLQPLENLVEFEQLPPLEFDPH
jgi:hypothetical protein